MKKCRKIILMLSTIFLLFSVCVGAAEYDITPERTESRMVLKVTSTPDERFSFQVLKEETDIKQLDTVQNPNSLVAYTGNFKTNAEGTATLNIALDSADSYVLYLKSVNGGAIIELPFYFMPKGEYTTLVGELNTALTKILKLNFVQTMDCNF